MKFCLCLTVPCAMLLSHVAGKSLKPSLEKHLLGNSSGGLIWTLISFFRAKPQKIVSNRSLIRPPTNESPSSQTSRLSTVGGSQLDSHPQEPAHPPAPMGAGGAARPSRRVALPPHTLTRGHGPGGVLPIGCRLALPLADGVLRRRWSPSRTDGAWWPPAFPIEYPGFSSPSRRRGVEWRVLNWVLARFMPI